MLGKIKNMNMSRFLKHFAETNALIFDNDKCTISSFFALKIKSTYSGNQLVGKQSDLW